MSGQPLIRHAKLPRDAPQIIARLHKVAEDLRTIVPISIVVILVRFGFDLRFARRQYRTIRILRVGLSNHNVGSVHNDAEDKRQRQQVKDKYLKYGNESGFHGFTHSIYQFFNCSILILLATDKGNLTTNNNIRKHS